MGSAARVMSCVPPLSLRVYGLTAQSRPTQFSGSGRTECRSSFAALLGRGLKLCVPDPLEPGVGRDTVWVLVNPTVGSAAFFFCTAMRKPVLPPTEKYEIRGRERGARTALSLPQNVRNYQK